MRRQLVKQRVKQLVRRTIGEPYVGKRMKLAQMRLVVDGLHLEPRRVLDAGSEDATFVYWLADRYREAIVTAVDVDVDAVATCTSARPRSYADRVAFEVMPLDLLPAASYDLITAFDVLEHINDDTSAVRDLAKALAPGGTLLVHVPRDRWRHGDGRVERVPDSEAWKINAGHVRMGYSPEALKGLLEGAGLDVVDVQTWVRAWGTRAHRLYARVERVPPLRLATLPFTDTAVRLDRGRPADEGNTVFARALKPAEQ